MKKSQSIILVVSLLIAISLIFLIWSKPRVSSNQSSPKSSISSQVIKAPPKPAPMLKLEQVTFFLENSGSMFGYVNTMSEYVQVVSELSHKSNFVVDNVKTVFNLINGDPIVITPIGSNPQALQNILNKKGFNVGDIKRSNLNAMFQKVLAEASGGKISILISDGIYDIGNTNNPLTALSISGQETKTKFLQRLMRSNFQTLMIKLNSDFKGDYCFASKHGSQFINHKRPYYIWVFGESQLLNKYFPEDYFAEKLIGYENYARFVNPENNSFYYQVVPNSKIGSFSFDHKNKNCLEHVRPNSSGQFQFTIAVDFSSLPFSEQYLTSPSNYILNPNFAIVSIKKPISSIHGPAFNTSHLITISTKKNPYGILNLSLKNVVPSWIESTHSTDELNINTDNNHTYGLKVLTNGISQAYQGMAKSKNYLTISVEIKH